MGLKRKSGTAGLSLVEVMVVLLIVMVVSGFAVPQVKGMVNSYRLRSAVASATWAIQSIRFQALEEGYPFQVTIQSGAGISPTYQIASEPPGTASFSNIGSAVPLSGQPVTLNQTVVLQFKPNGLVTATTGALNNIQISYASKTSTITVSNYGNISVN